MEPTLRIEGRALNWDFRGLWWMILDHTQCTRSTARILVELTDAVQAGPVQDFEVYRNGTDWGIRFEDPAAVN